MTSATCAPAKVDTQHSAPTAPTSEVSLIPNAAAGAPIGQGPRPSPNPPATSYRHYLPTHQFLPTQILPTPYSSVLTVQVFIHVLPEHVNAFLAATLDNARHSVQEPGVARFDVWQQSDDPTRFSLIEIYRDADAPAAHKATEHYARWRDTVAPMMAVPRTNTKWTTYE